VQSNETSKSMQLPPWKQQYDTIEVC
jgi:hypothetical protein